MLASKSRRLAAALIGLVLTFVASRASAANFAPPCAAGVGDTAALIAALATAAANGEDDTIDLSANCTYTVTTINATVSGSSGLAVTGDAAFTTTLHGNGATVARGATAPAFRTMITQGNVSIDHLTITGGSGASGFDGGGARVQNGNATFDAVRILGNTTAGFSWGGGFAVRPGAVAVVKNSVISGNNSTANGGGVSNESGTLSLFNTTIAGNVSVNSGGGVYFSGGTTNLTHVTITGNRTAADGGGIGTDTIGNLNIANTIVAANIDTSGGLCPDVTGNRITDLGRNLIGAANCSTSFTVTTLKGTTAMPLDAQLAALALNGGTTETTAIALTSPAINAADTAICANMTIANLDQVGSTRPAGACDIGAYELPTTATLTIDSSMAQTVFGQAVTFTGQVTLAPAGVDPTSLSLVLNDAATPLTTASPTAAGALTFTTGALEVGMHNLTWNLAAAQGIGNTTSATRVHQVEKASTTSVAMLDAQTIAVRVAAVAPGAGSPTGLVMLMENNVMVSSAMLTPGDPSTVQLSFASLSAGTHSVVAGYVGDAHFNASTSTAVDVTGTAEPVDAGIPMVDAGPVAEEDAGVGPAAAADAGPLPIAVVEGGGCDCRTSTSSARDTSWLAALLALLLVRPRRRTS